MGPWRPAQNRAGMLASIHGMPTLSYEQKKICHCDDPLTSLCSTVPASSASPRNLTYSFRWDGSATKDQATFIVSGVIKFWPQERDTPRWKAGNLWQKKNTLYGWSPKDNLSAQPGCGVSCCVLWTPMVNKEAARVYGSTEESKVGNPSQLRKRE